MVRTSGSQPYHVILYNNTYFILHGFFHKRRNRLKNVQITSQAFIS